MSHSAYTVDVKVLWTRPDGDDNVAEVTAKMGTLDIRHKTKAHEEFMRKLAESKQDGDEGNDALQNGARQQPVGDAKEEKGKDTDAKNTAADDDGPGDPFAEVSGFRDTFCVCLRYSGPATTSHRRRRCYNRRERSSP